MRLMIGGQGMGYSIGAAAVMMVVAVVLMLQACISIPRDTAARIAVQYATMKVVQQAREPARKAQRIRAIVSGALALVDGGDSVTLPFVEEAVRSRIDWDSLTAADYLAATALIEMLRTELEARIGAGELDPDALLPVQTVLGWVIEAAGAY